MHRQRRHCFAKRHFLALFIYFSSYLIHLLSPFPSSSLTLLLPSLIYYPNLLQSYSPSAPWCGGGSGQAGGQQDGVWPAGICIRPTAGLCTCKRADPWGETVQGREPCTASTLTSYSVFILLQNLPTAALAEGFIKVYLNFNFLHDSFIYIQWGPCVWDLGSGPHVGSPHMQTWSQEDSKNIWKYIDISLIYILHKYFQTNE